MRQFKLQLIIFFLSIGTATAQNFWETSQPKNGTTTADTDCPLYNADNPEINIEWQYAIGYDGDNYAKDIDFTPDSNFIILFGNNITGSYFAKYDKMGNELWSKHLKVTDDTLFGAQNFIRIGNDYYISGSWGDYYTRSFGVMKTNSSGNILWIKKLYENNRSKKSNVYTNPLIIAVENSHFLLSTEISTDLYNDSLLVAKYDSTCNKLWELNESDLGFEGRIFLDIIFTQGNYLAYRDNYYASINYGGDILSTSQSSENTVKIYFEDNQFYSCGYDYPDEWIRQYSVDFELKNEYKVLGPLNQFHVGNAVDVNSLIDGSLLVYYDYEYLGWNGNSEYNVQLLHLDKNLNCKSTINLYATGSQYSNKLFRGQYLVTY